MRFANSDESQDNIDQIFKEMIETVLTGGRPKTSRGYPTRMIPGFQMQFDCSSGNFPLVGLKFTPIRSITTELYCFLHGITDKKVLRDRFQNTIWNDWHNPQASDTDDLGPIYGYQWRNFGFPYRNDYPVQVEANRNWQGQVRQGDQLAAVLRALQTDRDSRRMVVSAWNPLQQEQMGLPPCHLLWNVLHDDGTLHLQWYQRSCDVMLGVPFNIASYALLLHLLCKQFDLKPGMLFGNFGDFHIYDAHREAADKLLERDTTPGFPLEILPGEQAATRNQFSMLHWLPNEVETKGYKPNPKIKLPVAV